MPKKDLTELARRLERHLGDPHDPASRMPYAKVLEYDEREGYPYEFVNLLQRWGALDHFLPSAQGGKAGDVEIGFNLMRLIARRDPTTATAFIITSLSFMPAWVAGTDEQKRTLVEAIQQGTRYAWGLSERGHGSDLTANEMTAEKTEGGYLLTGEKWLIGNGRVADGLSVHARTDPRGGPAGYSVFVLDKRRTPAGSVDELPRERMHGLRGLDMSGFRLDRVFVPDSALLGREGQGLEIALKTSQTARALISGIALSAVDTGLRVTLDFTEQRRVFGRTVSDIPYSRRHLAECFADLMVADAVSLGAVRALQVVPEQTSVWSSVVEYFVPTLLERTFAQLNVVLGARFYLRDHPHYAIHQKMMRDLPVANFADGNTVVNLKNIALQLEGLLAAGPAAEAEERSGRPCSSASRRSCRCTGPGTRSCSAGAGTTRSRRRRPRSASFAVSRGRATSRAGWHAPPRWAPNSWPTPTRCGSAPRG
ncbi:acyl-CoA dehydrogenase [Streptomyces sp. NPDC048179]|uniref:acyl-CoA dehydrogenase n=1 Tax=Streptomyces sp. NPDC048179 TaxID=3365506 RepID=UPI00370FA923